MPVISRQDIQAAKQSLSARLLQAGLRGGVVGRRVVLRVHAAVASAGANVHAVGVGRKVVSGSETTALCVRIYVAQKMPESLLSPRDRLPKQMDGVPTDVIESPPAFLLAGKAKKAKRSKRPKTAGWLAASVAQSCSVKRREAQRPVVAGISAAHHDVTAGTISCFCHSTRQGDDPSAVFALSNNHVFADVNKGLPGDSLYQPGPADDATVEDHFANLHRFVPMHIDGATPNRVDAAIGALLPSIKHKAEVCGIGRITGTEPATEGMQVRKHGRTSGYTEGVVTDESVDGLVGMDHSDPSIVGLFQDQVRIDRIPPHLHFGLGGDSGSLVFHKSRQTAVGLYFAGPDSGVYGLANHIQDVLSQLEIQLL